MISAAKNPEIQAFMEALIVHGFSHRRLSVDIRKGLCLSVQHQEIKTFEEGETRLYFAEADG